jgi:hypothetical protein
LLAFVGVLLTVFRIQAAAPSVRWIYDSYTSFDVVLTGTGPGWSGTITSPSGLWQLQTANLIGFTSPNPVSSLAFVENVGDVTFLGQLPSQFPGPEPSGLSPFNTTSLATFGGYMDYFTPGAPVTDENSLIYGFLHDLSEDGPYLGWSGMSTIAITSMPNPYNTSTWTWTANYSAFGANLEVPEPCTLSLAAMAAVGVMVRKRCRVQGATIFRKLACRADMGRAEAGANGRD